MNLYTDGTDWVIAADLDDARAAWVEHRGGEAEDFAADEWGECDPMGRAGARVSVLDGGLMSDRFMKLPPRGRSESGRPLCRWCKKEIPQGSSRRSWCSQACVDEYLVRSSGDVARRRVFSRDGGVCALCGLNTGRIVRILDILRGRARTDRAWAEQWSHEKPFTSEASDRARWDRALSWLRAHDLFLKDRWHLPHLWEADHVVPVAEGGGATGLENLRTLCRKCHARESGLLRRRLNAAKRPQLSLPEAK